MSEPFDVQYLKRMELILAGLPEDLRRQEFQALTAYLERAVAGLGRYLSEGLRARHETLLQAEIARYEEGVRSDAEGYRRAVSNLERYPDVLAEPARKQARRQFETVSKTRRDILDTCLADMERELRERGF